MIFPISINRYWKGQMSKLSTSLSSPRNGLFATSFFKCLRLKFCDPDFAWKHNSASSNTNIQSGDRDLSTGRTVRWRSRYGNKPGQSLCRIVGCGGDSRVPSDHCSTSVLSSSFPFLLTRGTTLGHQSQLGLPAFQ
jgi:hypothetical protein